MDILFAMIKETEYFYVSIFLLFLTYYFYDLIKTECVHMF